MAPQRLTDEQLNEGPESQLKNFKRTKDFFVAIDTDGCITGNMNIKQMLIFNPQFMEFFGLWGIETYFRETAEYFNLFSIERGCNRFTAISLILNALLARDDIKKIVEEKNIDLPDVNMLDSFISFARENKLGLGNPGLKKFISLDPTNLFLYRLLGWSEAVNRTFPHISVGIPLFKGLPGKLELISRHADIMVVSKTVYEDLVNYWEDQGISHYVQLIAGQEMGSKEHHIELAKQLGGYSDEELFMIGDGNGDLEAVKANNGLFYPVRHGKEQEDWDNFPGAFKKFTGKKYKGEFEDTLIGDFSKTLLKTPPWEEAGYDHIRAYREMQPIRKTLYRKYNPGGRLTVL